MTIHVVHPIPSSVTLSVVYGEPEAILSHTIQIITQWMGPGMSPYLWVHKFIISSNLQESGESYTWLFFHMFVHVITAYKFTVCHRKSIYIYIYVILFTDVDLYHLWLPFTNMD